MTGTRMTRKLCPQARQVELGAVFFVYPNWYKFVPKLIGRPELGYKKYLAQILWYKILSDRIHYSLIEQALLETKNTYI